MNDEQREEIESLQAIYPELVVDQHGLCRLSIDLPVSPSDPIAVSFSPTPLPTPPNSDNGLPLSPSQDKTLLSGTCHELHHLPPLHIDLTIPVDYPSDAPPTAKLSTSPEWLSSEAIHDFEQSCADLWQEYGKGQVLFVYLDHLQQQAEKVFNLPNPLTLPPLLEHAMLATNTAITKQRFDATTFDCGVCLEPKKGSSCYKLLDCRHVFCKPCLQDFYNNAITEGHVTSVKCVDPTCTKTAANTDSARTITKTLHPRELLDMGITEPQARRYVEMKRKKLVESNKATVYCPRTWCQAPSRSQLYPPIPNDLYNYPDFDQEQTRALQNVQPELAVAQDANVDSTPIALSTLHPDRLEICSKCAFAFCRICYSGWHGDLRRCHPRNPKELSVEEQASYDYLRLHTSVCPTCSSPVQKTQGCNHMTCFSCNTHFCYLCSAYLMPANPYAHFNSKYSECYQKLWELEEGDEGQDQGQFVGARRWEAEAIAVARAADEQEAQDDAAALGQAAAVNVVQQDVPAPVPGAAQIAHGPVQLDLPGEVDHEEEAAMEHNLAIMFEQIQMARDPPAPNDDQRPQAQPAARARRPNGRRQALHLPGEANLQAQRQPQARVRNQEAVPRGDRAERGNRAEHGARGGHVHREGARGGGHMRGGLVAHPPREHIHDLRDDDLRVHDRRDAFLARLAQPPQHERARGRGRGQGGRGGRGGRGDQARGAPVAQHQPRPRNVRVPLPAGYAQAHARAEAAQEAALRRFAEMAQRDEEEAWNSDELEEPDAAWRIL